MNLENDDFPINFPILKTHYSNQILEYLKNIPGKKALVFEENLLMVFSYIIGGLPKELEIEEKTILKDNALANDVTIDQLIIDLIPLAEDVLSLEYSNSFANMLLQDDANYYIYVRNAIKRLETIYGNIPYKYAKGNVSKKMLNDLSTMLEEDNHISINNNDEFEIDGLILLDRSVDLITPFCIQQTYEGLLDETFGIKTCSISVKAKILAQDNEETLAKLGGENKDIRMWLTDDDMTFKEIRNSNFASLDSIFPRKLMEIQKIIQEKDTPQTIEALSEYIKKVKNLKIPKEKDKLEFHINIAHCLSGLMRSLDYKDSVKLEQQVIVGEAVGTILDTIDLKLGKGFDRDKILRILCLLSLRENGLKPKHFDFMRREYIQSYGFKEVLTVLNLETAGLLKRGGEKIIGKLLRKKVFKLINEEVNIVNPNDIAYTYNGYAPMSVRLLEIIATSKGWTNSMEILKLLNGEVEIPPNEAELLKKSQAKENNKKIILVFYIGGVTYAEISAIRYLNKIYKDYLFVIGTTEIINGNSIIRQ